MQYAGVQSSGLPAGAQALSGPGGVYRGPPLPAPRLPDSASWTGAPPSLACMLGRTAESVGTGREFARSTLRAWHMTSLTDVTELVASELVTNALKHGVPSGPDVPGDYPVRLVLVALSPALLCTVTDPGGALPVLRDHDNSAENGRGLTVVEACSVRWGWHPLRGGGKVVWALLR